MNSSLVIRRPRTGIFLILALFFSGLSEAAEAPTLQSFQDEPLLLAKVSKKKTKKRKKRVSQKTKKNKARKKVTNSTKPLPLEVFFNFGLGPSMAILNGPLSDEWHYGLSLDLFLAIPQKVVKAHRDRMPKGFAKYVNPNEDLETKPFFLAFFPVNLTLSPKTGKTGIFGMTWSVLGMHYTHAQGEGIAAQVGVDFPSVTWQHVWSDNLRENVDLVGLGVSGYAKLILKFSKTFHLSAEWKSGLYFPSRSMDVTEAGRGGATSAIWHIGTAAILLHKRFQVLRTF